TLDNSFNPSGFNLSGFFAGTPRPIRGIVIQQSDNKVVIGGRFNDPPNGRVPLVRLKTDGSRDSSYASIDGNNLPNGMIQIRKLIIQADDRVIAMDRSVWRFNTDGLLDSSFHNVDLLIGQQDCPFGCCSCIGAFTGDFETNNEIFIGGAFSDIDDANGPPGPQHWGVAKLNADGTLDNSFTTSHRVGYKIEPANFLRELDGSTLIAFNRV